MEKHKENIIELRNIRSLSGLNFYIPDYQRGYRWTRTQAIAMLNDFAEFIAAGEDSKKVSEGYYCLQPVVVKPRSWKDAGGNQIDGYEVIDGQQRLTTLYLLLTALFSKDSRNKDRAKNFDIFSINYQTRSDSHDYLERIADKENRKEKAYECIDFYHINMVFESFEKVLDEDNIDDLDRSLVSLILGEKMMPATDVEDDEESECRLIDRARNVRVIWYEIGTDEKATAEDIFTRLNIGKIPLTNAELIKAMFLKESNFGKVTATSEKDRKAQQLGLALQQNKIAEEWNVIEQKLQRDDFWYFLGANSHDKEYETRIEFIFDLKAEWNNDSETYHTFNRFQEMIRQAGSKKPAEIVWKDFKDYFRELEYWYNDRVLYHLVGYLIECGYSIMDIMNLRSEKITGDGEEHVIRLKKDEFLKKIEGKVGNTMAGIDLDALKYPDENIRKVLLLFNVLSAIENQRSDIKFPFDRYKKEKWDKEHIASQTDKDKAEVPQFEKDRMVWIDDLLYYFTGIRDKDVKDDEGNPVEDADMKYARVIDDVDGYINSEKKRIDRISDEKLRQEGIVELEMVTGLLSAKKLAIMKPRQRTTEQKEEYDNLLKILFRKTRSYFDEDRLDEEQKDKLGNMALLNASINRSYGNAYFAIKRMHIQDKDSEGIFIPLTTKNVFMKYYSKRVDSMLVWTNDDASGYLAAIKNKLSRFLATNDNGKQ
ncbi:MAG: DUF262 domain-containing protein [Bacteroidales bacterium]|nr:DUF262 domain-containing protein [Bacteroidales bacterium]